MSASQETLDAVRAHLGQALEVGSRDGGEEPFEIRPESLVRVGRSRRLGALLDLELTVRVTVTDPAPLPVLETLLVAAETFPHTAIAPLPDGAPGLGFRMVLPVSVSIPEPTGPPVKQTSVRVHPLTTLTGSVCDEAGRAVPGARVVSSATRQEVRSGPDGTFRLVDTGTPTTLTATNGHRTAHLTVEPGAEPVRLVLSEGS